MKTKTRLSTPKAEAKSNNTAPQTRRTSPLTHNRSYEVTLQQATISPQTLTSSQVLQLQKTIGNQAVGHLMTNMGNNRPVQNIKNKTGMPNELKTGLENLSGVDLSDVRVHKNSSEPAKMKAHAFAYGSEIHLARGQEKHLPHEGWHVVQQKMGKVKPTVQIKGKPVNTDNSLEREADVMGAKALELQKMVNNQIDGSPISTHGRNKHKVVQRNTDFNFNDSEADDDDSHAEGGGNEPAWPHEHDLEGDTKTAYKRALDQLGVNHAARIAYQGVFQLAKQIVGNWYDYTNDPVNNNINFRNNLVPGGVNPEEQGSQRNLNHGVTIAKHGQMKSGRIVLIPGGKRYQHFSIADRLRGIAPAYRRGTWTWHHQTNQYDMVLVDMAVHRGFWHRGGYSFWN